MSIPIPNWETYLPVRRGTYKVLYEGVLDPQPYENQDGNEELIYTMVVKIQPQEGVKALRKFEAKFFSTKEFVEFCLNSGMKLENGAVNDEPFKNQMCAAKFSLSKDGTKNYLNSLKLIR